MSNGKKKINIRMKAFFPPGEKGKKKYPIYFFTISQLASGNWPLSAIRWLIRQNAYHAI